MKVEKHVVSPNVQPPSRVINLNCGVWEWVSLSLSTFFKSCIFLFIYFRSFPQLPLLKLKSPNVLIFPSREDVLTPPLILGLSFSIFSLVLLYSFCNVAIRIVHGIQYGKCHGFVEVHCSTGHFIVCPFPNFPYASARWKALLGLTSLSVHLHTKEPQHRCKW